MFARIVKYITKELGEQSKEVYICPIKFEIKNDSYTELKGEIAGPLDTPYEGATYVLDIKIPEDYPFKPPMVQFCTQIWHPNISSVTGAMCLGEWNPVHRIRHVLLAVQALLSAAEPDEPQDAVVAKQFKENPEMFRRTARYWASVYAQGPQREPELEQKVEQLKAMGFEENRALAALSTHNWHTGRAVEHLIS